MVEWRQGDGALLAAAAAAAAGDEGARVRRQQEGAGAAQQVEGLRRRGENLRQEKRGHVWGQRPLGAWSR